jgi:hypothetical protein
MHEFGVFTPRRPAAGDACPLLQDLSMRGLPRMTA